MTTIAAIARLGNQYCVSLLREAQIAFEDRDWLRAQQCICQCVDQLRRILHAEDEVLYPRLAVQGAGLGRLRANFRQHQTLIEQRARGIVASAMTFDTHACRAGIDALVDLLSSYWQIEREVFHYVAKDEQLLAHFAARLQM